MYILTYSYIFFVATYSYIFLHILGYSKCISSSAVGYIFYTYSEHILNIFWGQVGGTPKNGTAHIWNVQKWNFFSPSEFGPEYFRICGEYFRIYFAIRHLGGARGPRKSKNGKKSQKISYFKLDRICQNMSEYVRISCSAVMDIFRQSVFVRIRLVFSRGEYILWYSLIFNSS